MRSRRRSSEASPGSATTPAVASTTGRRSNSFSSTGRRRSSPARPPDSDRRPRRLLAALGAHVCVVGRDPARTESARRIAAGRRDRPIVDLSSLAETHAFARAFSASHDRLDVLVLNAGALTHEFTVTDEGYELTLATQVLSQFLLIRDLLPLLEAAPSGRVIVVALRRDVPRAPRRRRSAAEPGGLRRRQGLLACQARAGRARGGVDAPSRRHAGDRERDAPRLGGHTRPPKRPPRLQPRARRRCCAPRAQGADTIAWLAAAPEAAGRSGLFFLDRRARPTYRRRGTRRLDEAQERARLWELCQNATASFNGRDSVI